MSLSLLSTQSLKTLKKSKTVKLNLIKEQNIEIPKLKEIGNYKLGQEIGSGAFGKVILGKHIPTEEKVAIKILDKFILSQTPDDYQLVKQELSILKIVKHKNIVQLYEILETPRHIFIVMEYCEGGDIMNYILTRERLSENESLKFFHQLINALYYLHSQNIAHRDIKIDNLLLDSNYDLKLIDFGLSTKYSDDELLNQPCGTIVYAAPEVLDYKEYHGMLADVWSCGIVLYGMLSGFLPFGDSDDEINKKKVLEGKIKMPKFFSEEAKNLLEHMLDINPLTRYTLDDIMEHPWFNKMKFNITPGIIVGINSIPIDKKILDLCVTYNLDKNKVKNSVANNKFNNESAVYYLLVQKLKKMGKDSISDLCSEKYIDYMINEGNEFLNCSIYNNDYKDKDDLNEQNKQNQIIIERKRNKVLTGFKNYYNSLNIDNDNKYIQLNSEEISESQTKKKKFIKIENNFKENTISLDERKETNETIKNGATHRIKLPKTILKKNLIENNEESDYFLKEVMNQNSLDTDRIITRGKLIKNNKLVLIGKEKDNKKKNKIYIRNKNIPLDKYLNNKYFKTINTEQNKEKNDKQNKNKIKNHIINNNKNIKSYLALNSTESDNYISTYNNTNTHTSNTSYFQNKTKGKFEQKSGKYLKISKEKNNKNDSQNLSQKQNNENTTLINNDNNNSYIKKSKIVNPLINIPRLNINTKNNIKAPLKNMDNKRNITMNQYDINNIVNHENNIISKLDKIKEKRELIKTERNHNSSSKKILINLCYKNSNPSTIVPNFEQKSNQESNLPSNRNYNSTEKRKIIMEKATNNDKKLNKTSIMNIIDNFNLQSQFYAPIKKKYIISTKPNNKLKDHQYMKSVTPWEQLEIKTSRNNTNRLSIKKIYNLKQNINNNLKDVSNENGKIYKKNNNIRNKSKANKNIINLSKKIIQTNINKIKKNNKTIIGSEINVNKLNNNNSNAKCNTSRITVDLAKKKLRKRNLNRLILNTKLNSIIGGSFLNNVNEKPIHTTIFPSDKNNNNNNNKNSHSKIRFSPMTKISDNSKINPKRKINAESSVEVYRKKSPFQIRDLSDSPKYKFLNEKTRKNRIPWKLKRKGIDDKLESSNIFDRYIKKYEKNKNNIFKNKNYLKKININEHKIKINRNKSLNKKDKNLINPKLARKMELNSICKNYNNSYIIPESALTNANKINNLSSNHQKYFININDTIVNSHKNKKPTKNIKFRNINITSKTNKKLYTKYNNESYLTLNNTNIKKNNKINELPPKHIFANPVESRNINIFINEYKF